MYTSIGNQTITGLNTAHHLNIECTPEYEYLLTMTLYRIGQAVNQPTRRVRNLT